MVFRCLLILVLLLAAAPGDADAARPVSPRHYYGALAYNPKSGAAGYSYNQKSKREAVAVAMKECGEGCGVVKSFRNACGAIAVSSEDVPKRYALMTGETRELAEIRAQKKCGEACHVLYWTCTK